MNNNIVFAATVAAAIVTAASCARADFVYHYDLPIVSGAFGGGTATTTDLMGPNHGRLTTVTGPTGPGDRASAPLAAGTWLQRNVGGNSSVGITDHFPQNGNGSAYLAGGTGGKADLEYYFSTPHAASALTSFGYDWLRDSAGSAGLASHFHPSLRLVVGGTYNSNPVLGYLVFERAYNPSVSAVPVDTWVTEDVTGANLWSTGTLPDAAAVYNRDLLDWVALIPDLVVYGISFGIGSGWPGPYLGAVDNVSIAFSDGYALSANFEVPEPAAIGLFGLALLGLWGMRRSDKRSAPPAAA